MKREIFNNGKNQFEDVELLEMSMDEIKQYLGYHSIGITTEGEPELVYMIGVNTFAIAIKQKINNRTCKRIV